MDETKAPWAHTSSFISRQRFGPSAGGLVGKARGNVARGGVGKARPRVNNRPTCPACAPHSTFTLSRGQSMPYLGSANMQALAIRAANDGPDEGSMHPSGSPDGDTAMISVQDTGKADADDTSMEDDGQDRARRLKARNRRKRYLDVHPEYFTDASLELADPLLYDRLIRRFQTASEREAEGRRKGFSGQMATDLWRVEAKKDALSHPSPASLFTYTRGPRGEIHEADKDEVPMSREEGRAWWQDEMTQRFLRGDDDDFDYDKIDASHAYDDPEEERDIQDAYFDSMESDFDTDGEGKEKVLTGETGIQDY